MYITYKNKCEMWRYEEDTSQKRTELEMTASREKASLKIQVKVIH